jgi:hypothetical protein
MHDPANVVHVPRPGTLERISAIEAHGIVVVQTTRRPDTLTYQFPMPSMPKATIDCSRECSAK